MGKRYLLAPDSFKGSMTAKEVCEAMEMGIKSADPEAHCIQVPMADGGEGTVQSLVDATAGKIYTKEVRGPLGTPVTAQYGVLGDKVTAVIEMSSASGIQYVNKDTKNPLITTTYGTGELIKACIDRGIKKIILGIGGSATNDGGSGMAAALGYRFLDKSGQVLAGGGGYLDELDSIDQSQVIEGVNDLEIIVASDVTNPLCGEHGASAVFGPQKGATIDMVTTLDNNLRHYGEVVKKQLGIDIIDLAGAGGAGGLGGGLLAFTNATMQKGIEIMTEYTKLKEKLVNIDFCITGEGGIDFQTKFGKTPYGVAKAAKEINKDIKVIAIAGNVGKDANQLYSEGFDAIFSIVPGASDLDNLLTNGKENVMRTSESIARLLV